METNSRMDNIIEELPSGLLNTVHRMESLTYKEVSQVEST